MGHQALFSQLCSESPAHSCPPLLGQTGWYRLDQGPGLIGATVGALVVLFIWNRLVVHHVIGDLGAPSDSGAGPQGRRP